MASRPRVRLVPSTQEATALVTEHVLFSSTPSPVFFPIRAPLTIDDSDSESNREYDNTSCSNGGDTIYGTSSEIESEGFVSGEELESVPEKVEVNSSREENEVARPVLGPDDESASYATEDEGRTSEEDEHVFSIQPSLLHNVSVTRVMPIAKLSKEGEEEDETVNDEEDNEQFDNVSEIGFQVFPEMPRFKVSGIEGKQVETLVWKNPVSLNTAFPRITVVSTETVNSFGVKEYGPDTNETDANCGSGDIETFQCEYLVPKMETIFGDKLNQQVGSCEKQTEQEETINEGIELDGGVNVRMDALRLSKINVVCPNFTTLKNFEAAENNGVGENTSMKLGDADEFQLVMEGICFSLLCKENCDDTHVGQQYRQIGDMSNQVHETKTNYFVKALESIVLQEDKEGMEEDIEVAGEGPIVPQLVAGDVQQRCDKSEAPSCGREYSVDVEVKMDDRMVSTCYSSADDAVEHKKFPRIGSSEFSLSPPFPEAVFSETADLFGTMSSRNVGDQLIQNSDSLTHVDNNYCLDDIKERDANICFETSIEDSKEEGSACCGCTKDLTFSCSEAILDSIDYSTYSEGDILDNDSEQFKQIFEYFHEDMSRRDKETKFLVGTYDVTKSKGSKITETADDETHFAASLKSMEETRMTQSLGLKSSWLMQQLNLCPEDSNLGQMLNRLAASTGEHSEKLGDEEHPVLALNILVLGKGGVGKSATINSIFREEKVTTNAFEPATASVKEIVGMVNGVKIRILDTPGLRSVGMEQAFNRKLLSSIKKYMKKFPVDIVLYVDRLDTLTRDVNDFPLLRSITDSLNPSIWKNVIITLTHAAALPLDGASESPISYELYVAQKSHAIRKCIYQAVDDLQQNPLNFMYPVLLIENQQLRGKQVTGEFTYCNGLNWIKQFLLLCFYLKGLTRVGPTFHSQYHCIDWQSTGSDGCSTNFPDLFSQSRSTAHQESFTDQICTNFQHCSVLENEERGLEGMGKIDRSFVGEDGEPKNKTLAALAPVSIPLLLTVFLPISDETSFKCQNWNSMFSLLCVPFMDTHGWDPNCWHDGVRTEETAADIRIPPGTRIQKPKDRKLLIHLVFPNRGTQPTFGLSVKPKSKLTWIVDTQPQACYGQGIKMAVRFGWSNKHKATVRLCTYRFTSDYALRLN